MAETPDSKPTERYEPYGAAEATPERIGPYRILGVLGEGGMGTVYQAEQREPIRRLVAIKVIKLGMDSRQVLARFELERRALAAMSHGNIAKVFEVGTTESGQPFFVMEFVEGPSLTSYCDKHRLSLERRIDLFAQVCAGVQHAHQKGVVHRDLKPGNILVVREGDRAVPKILDFGLAKAINRDLLAQTIVTEREQILGTPEYMAPEQASSDHEAVDARADIYALGVVLYELLTGELPFASGELRKAGWHEIERKLREDDPPKPSTRLTSAGSGASERASQRCTSPKALSRALRGDLDWVILKAMAKEPERRYDSATALAMDLQRYLSHDPVIAGPPSASYRLRKLLRRYRVQFATAAAVLLTAIGGAVVAIDYAVLADRRAEQNERLARSNGDLAAAKGALAADLAAKVSEFDQLAGVVLYERAIATEKTLYPPWPDRIAALETWLREDCGALLAKREEIERTLSDLRDRALPQTEVEERRDRDGHPRFDEWQRGVRQLASARRAQAIRTGREPQVAVELTESWQALPASTLDSLAWERIATKPEQRAVYGEEAVGLACARLAVAKVGSADLPAMLTTLAWALLANGQDAEARQRSEQALASAPADQQEGLRDDHRRLERAIAQAAETLVMLEERHAMLTKEVNDRRTWTFTKAAPRFLHDALSELLARLDDLDRNEKGDVERRLRWARAIGQLTRAHPNARVTWAAARAAIAASERYRGQAIELRDEDVIGLVPIGANPVTGLWEFYELRSAWDAESEPAAIPIPVHDVTDGRIEVTAATGIVFVLLPGGTFTMGAQLDSSRPNHDPNATEHESPVHEVSLAPFFLARHELTQGQWERLRSLDVPQLPSRYGAGSKVGTEEFTLAHPVEQIDWVTSHEILTRHGMLLPTEAQWEYGCRGGGATPWSCPFDELAVSANLADATAKRGIPTWTCEAWDDAHIAHAAVGSFAGNGFGLHDVHGNVWEWCLDEFGSYAGPVRDGDGLRLQRDASARRVYRGGSFNVPAVRARSAYRVPGEPTFRNSVLGVRVARALRPHR